MGSSLSYIYDKYDEEKWEENLRWISSKAIEVKEEIEKTKPGSCKFDNLKWLLENKDKILRNKKLIDLIG
ncbi:hypothetical protein [Proteiniphilum sp. UBA5463]|jgi:hypothetical protein|uniref:hypothetical protein n=1 Tax=Proteiniphilum sp. UBA5463 TaxID=1947281 RepID=UPI00257A6080|nr:hypothetical protein [Proteiniphilum sp. UBA5463]